MLRISWNTAKLPECYITNCASAIGLQLLPKAVANYNLGTGCQPVKSDSGTAVVDNLPYGASELVVFH